MCVCVFVNCCPIYLCCRWLALCRFEGGRLIYSPRVYIRRFMENAKPLTCECNFEREKSQVRHIFTQNAMQIINNGQHTHTRVFLFLGEVCVDLCVVHCIATPSAALQNYMEP